VTVCAGLIVPEVWALKVKPVGNTAAEVTAKADVAAIRAALRTNICTTRLLALVSIRRFIILTSEHGVTALPMPTLSEPRAQPEL
jgi:hypothetical protein